MYLAALCKSSQKITHDTGFLDDGVHALQDWPLMEKMVN